MAELNSDSDYSDFSDVLSFNSDSYEDDDALESGYHNRGVQPYAFEPVINNQDSGSDVEISVEVEESEDIATQTSLDTYLCFVDHIVLIHPLILVLWGQTPSPQGVG